MTIKNKMRTIHIQINQGLVTPIIVKCWNQQTNNFKIILIILKDVKGNMSKMKGESQNVRRKTGDIK